MNLQRLGTEYGGWTIDLDSLSPGDVVLDIGVGLDISFSESLLARVPVDIVFVDPSPDSQTYVKRRLPTAKFVKFAVSDSQGAMPYYLNPVGSSSLCKDHQRVTKRTILVPCVSLGGLVETYRPALVKMDIEGEEYTVYRQCFGVRQVAIEFHHRMMSSKTSKDTETVVEQFLSAGYRVIYRSDLDEITFLKDAS